MIKKSRKAVRSLETGNIIKKKQKDVKEDKKKIIYTRVVNTS